jgi:hypothetical protein
MANNCNDFQEQLLKLQEENQRLRQDLDTSERARKAGDAFLRTEVKRQWVITMQDGSVRSIADSDIERAYSDFAARLESKELQDFVDRSMGLRAKPLGREGRFLNYRMLIENANVQNAEDYAKLTEALTGTWKEMAPDDYAFVTQTFGRERLLRLVADAYREFTDADTIATALANNTAGFMNLAEKMTRLRFFSDMAKGSYLDTLGEIIDFMESTSDKVSDDLRKRGFSAYKLALMSERHVAAAKRNTGQALRSLQENFDAPDNFRVDMAEAQQTLGATARETVEDEHFGRVMAAIDNRDVEQMRQLKIAAAMDAIDPNAKLGKGWANTHMRFGNVLVKDSQLTNVRSQLIANVAGTWLANTHGFVHQAFENIGNLTPIGTRFSREAFGEGLRVAWESANYSHQGVRRAFRELAADSFLRGDAPYGGNYDTYGPRMSSNDKLLAQVRGIIDEPYLPGGPMRPQNWARTVHKLQAATRLFAYDKLPDRAKTPAVLMPALRAMSATDSVLGFDAFLFKLKNDLEIRARRDGAQLGLFDSRSREEWVEKQLDAAFYKAAPTEENVLSFRRQHSLKGSDISDDEIRKIITAERVKASYGYPTMDGPEAEAAMDYSLRNRMQNTPGEEGSMARRIDAAMMEARKHWAVDSLVPYWRAPFNAFLFDTRLSFGPLRETVDLMFEKNPTQEQIAKVQAGWTLTGGLLALFAGLDMMGLIEGNGPLEPNARRSWMLEGRKPNSIAGVPYLGGLPILNTLFLWKDIKETFVTGTYSNYDQRAAHWGIAQVLTSQLIRQTGFGQLQRLIDALLDPERQMPRLVGWLGQGQLPGSGVMRDLQRATGYGASDLFQDRNPLGTERFLAGEDDPFVKIERGLRTLAFSTIPLLGIPGGAPRKEQDFLGQPVQLEFGTDWKEALKSRFHPRIWPRANQRVYAELDAQGQLRLPQPLLTRNLAGVAMSGELQKEYNDTFGTVKGEVPLSMRLELAGRKVNVTLPMSREVVLDFRKRYPGSGLVVAKDGETISFDMGPFLDKHVQGRTIVEAFTSLFNDPVYKRMQDLPGTTSNLAVADMPPAERRKQAASQMIQGIYDYYGHLTSDQLEASDSSAARDWRMARSEMDRQRFERSAEQLPDLIESLQLYAPAQRPR